jgi:hypothetical protein
MLVVMDTAAAQASVAPWIAIGVLLTVAAVLLAGLVVALILRRRAGHRAAEPAPPSGYADDDLPGFLESPPGISPTARPGASAAGFVPLAVPPSPPPPPPPRRTTGPLLASTSGAAVLLLAAAAVIAAVSTGPDPGRHGQADRPGTGEERGDPRDRGPDAVEARLTFGGVVLEERAVGVTATYPELVLTEAGDGPVARLTLPTWNCLATEAPADPAAAGCVPGRTEYAELRAPALTLTRDGEGLLITGRFPTEIRSNGAGPELTGRVYALRITVEPEESVREGEWISASGVLELGDGQAASRPGSELRLDV